MSDFIDHLLAQVRPDAETALAPRVQSRFEPLPAAEDGGFDPAAAPEPAVATPIPAPMAELSPPRQTRPPPRVQPLDVQESEVAPRPLPAEARITPLRAEETRPAPVEPEADSPAPHDAAEPPFQPAAELWHYEVQVPAPAELAEVEPGEVFRETIVRESLREIVPAEPSTDMPPREVADSLAPAADPPPLAAAAPAQPQLARAIPEAAPPASPAPIVEIRIGRIEIHSAEPAAPSVEAAPAPVAAGASRLDRYLARS